MADISRIKNDVATVIKRQVSDLLNKYEENLALTMNFEVSGYKSDDFAVQDGTSKHAYKHDELMEDAINKIISAELLMLFNDE